MHCAELAEAYNMNGLTEVTVAAMQEDEPAISEWLFGEDIYVEGVSADEAEEIDLYREQPECHSILANLQPRCSRYFARTVPAATASSTCASLSSCGTC